MIVKEEEVKLVSAYAEVEKRGLQKGIELGKAQMKSACAQAETKGRAEIAVNMLKDGSLPVSKIAKFSGLSEKKYWN